MTIIEIMAKAAWTHVEDTWDKASLDAKWTFMDAQRAAIEAIIDRPLVNINLKVSKHIRMQPADVDLVVTAVLRAILAEKSK